MTGNYGDCADDSDASCVNETWSCLGFRSQSYLSLYLKHSSVCSPYVSVYVVGLYSVVGRHADVTIARKHLVACSTCCPLLLNADSIATSLLPSKMRQAPKVRPLSQLSVATDCITDIRPTSYLSEFLQRRTSIEH